MLLLTKRSQTQMMDVLNVHGGKNLTPGTIISTPEILLCHSGTFGDENTDFSRLYTRIDNNTGQIYTGTKFEFSKDIGKITLNDKKRMKTKKKLFYPNV